MHRRNVKTGVSSVETRRKRERHRVELRKQRRDENLTKLRLLGATFTADASQNYSQEKTILNLCNEILTLKVDGDLVRPIADLGLLLTSAPPTTTQAAITTGVLQQLTELLDTNHLLEIRLQSLNVLGILTAGSYSNVDDALTIPRLVQLLAADHDELRLRSLFWIEKIVATCSARRDLAVKAGALEAIRAVLDASYGVAFLRSCTWTIFSLVHYERFKGFEWPTDKASLVKTLVPLTYNDDQEVIQGSFSSLVCILDDDAQLHRLICEPRFVGRMVEVISKEWKGDLTAVLQVLGSIIEADCHGSQMAVRNGVLPSLARLLASCRKSVRSETLRILANILLGGAGQIQEVIHANIFTMLYTVLADDEFDLRSKAALAVCNSILAATPKQVEYLVQIGFLVPLCDLLGAQTCSLVDIALDAIGGILRKGTLLSSDSCEVTYAEHVEAAGGFEKMGLIQYHPNSAMSSKASTLLDMYS